MQRLRKPAARKAFENGRTVYVIGHKLMPFTMYALECPLNKADIAARYGENDFLGRDTFDSLVQNYTWYNCSFETGYYPAFYVK